LDNRYLKLNYSQPSYNAYKISGHINHMTETLVKPDTVLDTPGELAWLTPEYVRGNGWRPVPDEWMQEPRYPFRQERTPFGTLPCRSSEEISPGDVIIFDCYGEREEGGRAGTDRFFVVTAEYIEQCRQGKESLMPNGVVVSPPSRN
jgi:hypothetical protein